MTKISRETVQRLALLSRLQVNDDEADKLAADMTEILSYIEQLDELDTSDTEPTYQVTGLSNVWRDDVVDTEVVSREDLLGLAPESTENQIKVPKVL